ncbi:hypothetical protein LHYA1_G000582 [Lachnellula hyalina]|uniref:Uncharacterized protein n=1 Tax=Lachnellula hyalina TaxID=1316788 RepID=A0A8H8RC08_9HELO|nr:uncharacterized protein LHYA1_G000582 [Lachnellula hyalina]TVY30576.1 hypothetical protein LHYA1_G000582 [Lachnellula hyalina]
MDAAYNQHSPYARHQSSRSSTNLHHLTLAPLTSRLPITDLPDTSYIEGRSAPTTPSILSRSSARKPQHASSSIPKSKSSSHLLIQPRSGASTPAPGGTSTKLKRALRREEVQLERNDSDWLLRAGAMISSSARESKGQAWLISRASSTSLTAQRDEEDEELAREREVSSRRVSRRGSGVGSFDADDEFSPVTTRRSFSFGLPTGTGSRPLSRFPSRVNSRRGSMAQLFTPLNMKREGYFDHRDFAQEVFTAEPDFVDVEEEVYENTDEAREDDAVVRKLASTSSNGLGGWVERMLGWSLFAVDEDGEETETDTLDEKAEDSEISSGTSRRTIFSSTESLAADVMPPLRDEEAGGWQDAAWLLSVATKVIL